jgi:FixJ family two-component response regulator
METGRDGSNFVLYIVDADASVRDALCRLATSVAIEVRSFATAEDFVAQASPDAGGCVLLDSSLLAAASRLVQKGRPHVLDWPVIVMCASDSEARAARIEARRLGARLLLSKPLDAQALLDAVAWVTEDEGQSLISEPEGDVK